MRREKKEMEGLQHHRAGSCSYLNDVNEKSVKDNNNHKMTVARSTTTSSTLYSYEPPPIDGKNMAVNKSKSSWWCNEAERKRQRRVAKYKLYATEGKIKHSFKKGFRWFKIKCINIARSL
ncbi:unnamed protein product [Sphenostylis stenocarpa]|uniref:Uncharacterized protein n=1 Tax=Sphenostylis stenocarpa TaxID=92480 RepID=A0AA86RPP8_9FABA|nr:unnamed protein product [Sphenostylis stenocarpa]